VTGCGDALDAGVVRAVLGAIDCHTRDFAQRGFISLTGPGSPFQTALTLLLTLYVAAVGYRLLFAPDGARLSDAPRLALKVGAILALVTSWSVFQTLVFDVAAKAPFEIAALISAPGAQGLSRDADPVGRLQAAYDQLSSQAIRFDKAAGPVTAANASREASAARALAAAGGALLMANAGLIAVGRMAVELLTAIGPVFIALFLFPQTRGLFVGWVRALVAAGMISLTGWTLTVLVLDALEPWLDTLAEQGRSNLVDPPTAVTAAAVVFVFAAGQIGVALAGGLVALGLRLPLARETGPGAARAPGLDAVGPEPAPAELISRTARLADQLRRPDPRISRAGQTAGAVAAMAGAVRARGGEAEPAFERVGDLYRRPAVRGRRLGAPS
jgi:type IV secretion system protein VirB6